MSPEEIRKLRNGLQCTARELAATLGVDPGDVAAWEQSERFPTKKLVTEMERLQARGPTAIVRKKNRKGATTAHGVARMADPAFWLLMRKLVEHPELFDKALALSEGYSDPSTASTNKA